MYLYSKKLLRIDFFGYSSKEEEISVPLLMYTQQQRKKKMVCRRFSTVTSKYICFKEWGYWAEIRSREEMNGCQKLYSLWHWQLRETFTSQRKDAKAKQGWRLFCCSLQRVHNLSQISEGMKYFWTVQTVNLALSLIWNINKITGKSEYSWLRPQGKK